jgi:hypothetical protein
MKSGYLEGDMPSRDDALEMIDEIKRIRAELAVFKEGIPSLHDFNHADIQIGGGGEAMRVHQWLCRIIASIAAMKEGEG